MAAASPARSLYRAVLRALRPLARDGGDLPLRAPLDADTAWGQHRFAPAGAAYEREALAALVPGELAVPPEALFPPATAPRGSGASPDFEPQRRYGAADLRRLAAANFRAPLLPVRLDAEGGGTGQEPAAGAAASAAAPVLVPRMAQALAALRALPEQLVLERGSSSSWHEGVLVEATARFMHATPASAPASSGSSGGGGRGGGGARGGLAAAAIGGGALPLALPPHVQAAAARLLGVALPAGGGSSGNEEEDDEDEDEDEDEQEEEDGGRLERRARVLALERRRRSRAAAADAADAEAPPRQHVFTYRVRVTNARGAAASSSSPSPTPRHQHQPPPPPPPRVQILGREWSIWDGDGELKGLVPLSTANAVVGQQPVVPFGGCFEYSSGTPLEAPRGSGGGLAGTMRGRLALAVREATEAGGGGGGGSSGGGSRITATPLVVPIAEFRLLALSSDPREEGGSLEREQEQEEEEEGEGDGRAVKRRRATRRRSREPWRWLTGGGVVGAT